MRRATSRLIAMLARDGEIAWLGTTGEMAPGIPMREDAILPLVSVGKMFTATAATIQSAGTSRSSRMSWSVSRSQTAGRNRV